jgi:hypothetical protein
MDDKLAQAFSNYQRSLKTLNAAPIDIAGFTETPYYEAIRTYLDINELIAVGIHKRIFDETICYEFWSGELLRCYPDSKSIIDYVRNQAGYEDYYEHLLQLNNEWQKRELQRRHNSPSAAVNEMPRWRVCSCSSSRQQSGFAAQYDFRFCGELDL